MINYFPFSLWQHAEYGGGAFNLGIKITEEAQDFIKEKYKQVYVTLENRGG